MCIWRDRSTLGIFWKRLTSSLDNTFTIIEGAMRIHNFLVDYRDDNMMDMRKDFSNDLASHMETVAESGIIPGVVVNDNHRPSGRIANDEKVRRLKGIISRDELCMKIANHNMVRPRKNWRIDEHNHTIID